MPAPVTSILDHPTRADENPIAGGWAGPVIAGGAQMKVSSNKFASGVGSVNISYWNTLFGPSQEAYVTLDTAWPSSKGFELWAKLQNPGAAFNAYTLYYEFGTNVLQVYKYLAGGGGVQLGGDIHPTVPFASGVGCKTLINVAGSSILTSYFDGTSWTLAHSLTDPDIVGSGYIGMDLLGDPTGRCINFGGGTLPAPTRSKTLGLMGKG